MAYTEQDILGKIGDLLVDVNEQFASIQKNGSNLPANEVNFLAAKVKFLAAHMDLWSALLRPNSEESVEIASQEVFTPAVLIAEEEADDQPVIEEIQEQEFVYEENPELEVLPEIETVTPEVSHTNAEAVVDHESEKLEDDQIAAVVEPEVVATHVEEPKESFTSASHTFTPASPIHTSSSEYTAVKSAHELEEQAIQETPSTESEKTPEPFPSTANSWSSTPVPEQHVQTKEVIIEEKQVNLTEQTKEDVTLNDLAKQAEVRPNRPLTLNELIQQQKQAGVTNAQQFVTQSSKSVDAVVDLKTGVSLNDKLLFIKDLFNGYSLAYSEAIELLNRFDNFAEADAFLQSNYALKNNWSAKPQTVDKLYGILRKKFI
ncbi:hypothetical protein ACFRAE_02055 [Sphingobacterium sp. HJSM2_6]|uniref:hypothetical protein n=1 Tax=Sphingobacterium sp. HJSM2_6 TaxID=3366264 RepID=UPI003BBE53EC